MCRRIEAQIRQFLALLAGVPLHRPAEAAGAGETAGAAADDPLTDLELYSGLLAGLGKKTRKRQLKRWVKQGKQLPPELAAEAASAAALRAAGGSVNGGSAEAAEAEEDGGSDGEEGEEEEEGSEGQPPAASSSANGNGAAAAAAGLAVGAGVGPADLRNTGHLWHGNEVRCPPSGALCNCHLCACLASG